MGFAFTPTRLNDLVVDVSLSGVAHGDILYRGASKWNNLAPGNAGDVLTSGGAGASPSWAAAAGGAPFDDATAIVKGSVDATKLLRFEVDGFTAGVTRVLTPPNADATIAGLGVTQTFSAGQTFSSTALFTGSVASPSNGVNLGDAGNTPRVVLTNPTSSISIDNNAGNFRIIDTSTVKLQYTNSSNLIAFACNLSVGNDTTTVPPNSARAWIYHNVAAGTSAVNTTVVFEQNTNGTPAAGFGGQLLLRGKSSTTSNIEMGSIDWLWATETHASRKARGILYAYDTAARECIRFEADGTYGLVGIGGATSALAHMTVNVGAAANKGIVIKAAASQSGDLIEMQDSSGNRRAAFGYDDPLGSSSDSFCLVLRPGTRSYTIGTFDGGGSMYFGRSDSSNSLRFTPDSSGVVLSAATGYIQLKGNAATTGAIITPYEAGGVGILQIGRRYSDSSSSVGSSSEFWPTSTQTEPVIGTVKAGGGTGGASPVQWRFSVDKEGDIYLKYESSTTNARDRFSIVSTWATSTDASRKARAVFNIYDTAARECIRFDTDGSAAALKLVGDGGATSSVVVGSNTITPLATYGGLDVSSGGFGLALGADNNANTRTNTTTKIARFVCPHYTNSEEPLGLLIATSTVNSNEISYGGDSSIVNAATLIKFFTGANNTTTDGTERMRINSTGLVGIGSSSPSTRLHVTERSATTNAVVNVCTVGFNSTGTPAAGLGGGLVFTIESSTTEDTTAALFSWEWVSATHASRTARGKLIAYDTAARECIRIEASGSAPMVGFFGAAAVIQQAGTGEATGFTAGAGTTVTDQSTFTGNVGSTAYRINDVVKALKNLGLLTS